MEAFWWKDNSQAEAGNILSYCCIDAIPRDFARLGQLFLNGGSYAENKLLPKRILKLSLRLPWCLVPSINLNFGSKTQRAGANLFQR